MSDNYLDKNAINHTNDATAGSQGTTGRSLDDTTLNTQTINTQPNPENLAEYDPRHPNNQVKTTTDLNGQVTVDSTGLHNLQQTRTIDAPVYINTATGDIIPPGADVSGAHVRQIVIPTIVSADNLHRIPDLINPPAPVNAVEVGENDPEPEPTDTSLTNQVATTENNPTNETEPSREEKLAAVQAENDRVAKEQADKDAAVAQAQQEKAAAEQKEAEEKAAKEKQEADAAEQARQEAEARANQQNHVNDPYQNS